MQMKRNDFITKRFSGTGLRFLLQLNVNKVPVKQELNIICNHPLRLINEERGLLEPFLEIFYPDRRLNCLHK